VTEDGVVVELASRFAGRRLRPGACCRAVAELDEGADLVHGHEVLDAVGELAGGVAGVVGEGLAVSRFSQPPLSWRAWGRSQWKRVQIGLDAGGEERVDHRL
jgi:hypothetical protein